MKPTRPELPREFVAVHKRRRMIDAIAELTSEQGYEATKIADIVSRAGVARKTLYDNFDGKEALLIAAFDASLSEVRTVVAEECESALDGDEHRVEAGILAFLRYLEENPARAHLCMVEALSATPAAAARYDAAVAGFVALLRASLPAASGPVSPPATLADSLVGGIAWIVQGRIRAGETAGIAELAPELSRFVLSPYSGVTNQR